ncbi:MAG: BolA family transcriptional regulator [bacterium]|nr:BolA family transcriptional regulator [bacterium]MCP5070130.1 BolA family transcriptional regulator [bacterium]
MVIQILSSPPPEPEETATQLEQAIREGLPGAEAAVRAISPGHFEVEVVSGVFEGLSRVKQQQAVYATIKHLMAGDSAPVHAIDRMVTRTP